jgi:putative FmdB family regulatory protein
MPTYEYQCADCGFEFEKFQSMTARALRKCPRCGKLSLDRLIGAGAGVIFKGSGFYETDYRSESYKNAAKKETGAGSEKNEKKETKAETKTGTGEEKPAKPKNEKKSA